MIFNRFDLLILRLALAAGMGMAISSASSIQAQQTVHDSSRKYSLKAPNDWIALDRAELERIVQEVAPGFPNAKTAIVNGFRPKGVPGELPLILIHWEQIPLEGKSHEDYELSYGKKIAKQDEGPLLELIKRAENGQPISVRSRHCIVMRVNSGLTCAYMGKHGVVNIHCFEQEEEFEKTLPVFLSVIESFSFDPGWQFSPGSSSSAKGVNTKPLAKMLGGVFFFVFLFLVIWKLSRRKRPTETP